MRAELARLLREQPRTVVLVTHDIEEAAQLADRVLVLSRPAGRIRDEVRLRCPASARGDRIPRWCAAVHRILDRAGARKRTRADAAAPAAGEEVAVTRSSPGSVGAPGALLAVAALGVLRAQAVAAGGSAAAPAAQARSARRWPSASCPSPAT